MVTAGLPRPAARFVPSGDSTPTSPDHLAGALGAALCQQLPDREWITRMPEPRIVRLTPAGQHGLAHSFDLAHIPEPRT